MAFTKAPLKRIIKSHGIRRVSADALDYLAAILEERLSQLALESDKISKHSGRKTILRRDVKLARKVVGL
ncbi:MAG: NFYB/HAP3 family transcription factor subunit [Candidatus Aenigmarchaeota archaeon]|nr:NFYB/HAP3 family transcription factor subunit [Candidatus Aenigmarchaeota archaeon]